MKESQATLGFLVLLGMVLPIEVPGALWDNPIETSGDWKRSGWYGWIQDQGTGWIYHTEHGWTFAAGETFESVWFHDLDLGWQWTSETVYPWYWNAATGMWLYYHKGTRDPRWWHDPESGYALSVYPGSGSPVELRTESYDWRHREFFQTEDHELIRWTRNIVTTSFETQVIENDLIRVTLLPGWGARILSIVYKPFGMELLSHAKGDKFSDIIYAPGAFYYDDWLLLPGGINPTFPEGEHGKYWGIPWDVTIVEETADKVTVRMSKQDDIDWTGTPEKFNNGLTGMIVDMDVTVYRGRATTEITYTLTNSKAESIAYEFWTAASLAPLPQAETATSSNLEIVMDQEKIILRDWWNWMKAVEIDDSTSGDDVFRFDALAWLGNWQGSGIAYAYPLLENPWWGVINHDYNYGSLRTTNDPANAPGMKIWATGADYGLFELWSGNSPEFFEDAYLGPNEIKSWSESFIPTIELDAVSNATAHGAIQVDFTRNGETVEIDLVVFSSWQPANWSLRLNAIPASGEAVALHSAVLNFSPQRPTEFIQLSLPIDTLPQLPVSIEVIARDYFSAEQRIRFTFDL